MELGRECLETWGYKRVDELIWVKTNQLQRLIRTGRTGHWLNHSKEHCLVGVKGEPATNRCIDCDVLVAEARDSSDQRPVCRAHAWLHNACCGTAQPCAWRLQGPAYVRMCSVRDEDAQCHLCHRPCLGLAQLNLQLTQKLAHGGASTFRRLAGL